MKELQSFFDSKKKYFIILINIMVLQNIYSQQSRTYILLVGVDTIDEDAYKKYCENSDNCNFTNRGNLDISVDLSKIEKLFNVKDHDTIILKNKKATKKAIIAAIEKIGGNIAPNDYFVFYFTGHGYRIENQNGDMEPTKCDQALVTYDDFLLDDEINALLVKYFTQSKNIMFIDSCYSGSMYKFFSKKFKSMTFESKCVDNTNTVANKKCHINYLTDDTNPYNLIYFGATSDSKLTYGHPVYGSRFTYKLDKVLTNNKILNYTDLACQLGKKLYSGYKTEDLQYHEIGPTVQQYSKKIPFKFD